MGIESNRKIIFRVPKCPSRKAILVSIPMNMYRIQTHKFDYGMNFFQKAVLSLKANPQVTNSDIADFLGWEEELVDMIVNELKYYGLLDNSGFLTDKGNEKLRDIDSIVIDENQTQIGYVFQYLDRDEFYSSYEKELGDEPDLEHPNAIIVGTKGDGKDRSRTFINLDFIENKSRTQPTPKESILLDLIAKSSKKEDIWGDMTVEKIKKSLSLSYFGNKTVPTPVSICTYVYLPEREDDLYESDWRVLDPFGHGDSSQLKFYLESFHDPTFNQEIKRHFLDAPTIANKNFNDFNSFIQDQLKKKRAEDFELKFKEMDRNLQTFLDAVIKDILILQNTNYEDESSGEHFVSNTQKVLETMLLTDVDKRKKVYNQMLEEYTSQSPKQNYSCGEKRQQMVQQMLDAHIVISHNPEPIVKLACKGSPRNSYSLKQYVINLLLTYSIDKGSPLFKVIQNKIDWIFEIANLRNEKSHGQTEKKVLKRIPKEEIEKIYETLKEIINNYMTTAL